MDWAGALRIQAHANRLANRRLHEAVATLPASGFRGQAHSMLSQAGIAPPQLDEFLMPSDAPLRVADMAALGWSEGDVYG